MHHKIYLTSLYIGIDHPFMIVSPNKQVPIKGIANICRYLSRQFCGDLYEDQTDPVKASQIDVWLDLLTTSFIYGNAKEKGSVLRNMNACLGTCVFLTGNGLSLADIVLYSVIGTEGDHKLGSNVKQWIKRCQEVIQLAQIPCAYLE